MPVIARPSRFLALLRGGEARRLWPALLVLFALGSLFGAPLRQAAAADGVERCLTLGANQQQAGLAGHSADDAACLMACVAAPGAAGGLPAGHTAAVALVLPRQMAAEPVLANLPAPILLLPGDGPRGPPAAI